MGSNQPGRRVWYRSAKGIAGFAIPLGLYLALAWGYTGGICVLYASVGLPCPGCGLSRAWGCAWRGQWLEALAMHPLFWYPVLMLAVWAVQRLRRGRSNRWFTVFLIASCALFFAVYAVRMAALFPHTIPMVWNRKSFLWRICRGLAALFRR
ncbi:MAG: DUF2752 domain-containing protein [Oscillospiraceae bacterium]|jgi:hypothetical protein|nr:DUF2752 domain-containing protein [Oscillospiraceae bacterium]